MKQIIYWAILFYLRFLAKLQLIKVKPLIIGITGSAGKTSLRYAVAAILQDKYKVKMSSKANSETGIPLNILGFPPRSYAYRDWLWLLPLALWQLLTNWEKYDIYIVELGVDSPCPPKNMAYLLTIVQPKIGVFLNVLPVHSAAFDSLVPTTVSASKRKQLLTDLIAAEKGKLIASLPQDGWAILNSADKRVIAFKNKTKAQVITFGSASADLRAGQVQSTLKGFSIQVIAANQSARLQLLNLPLPQHYAQTFLAAIAVANSFNIPLKSAVSSLQSNFHLPPGRLSLIPGLKNSLILDSSYNASRAPMISALNLLNRIAPARRLAVLGDMRELGQSAKIEHQLVARTAVKTCDIIVTVGPLMKQYLVPEVLRLGFPQKNLYSFTHAYQAAKALKSSIIQNQDTVLVKGSQNTIFLEIVVQALMKNPQDSERLLCRRGKFWDKKRRALR